jgi:DNA primase
MAPQSGRIPQSFIKDLLSRVDIVPLVQESVELKKRGNNYTACCPFHNEKTPSFSVSHSKQFYHCFGCGVHGDAIEFLVAQNGYTFLEAVEKLCLQVGLKVPKPQSEPVNKEYSDQLAVLNRASQFYIKQWKVDSGAKAAADYLKSRGLTGEVAKQFALGFAPNEWHLLDSQLQGNLRKSAFDVGLIMKNDKGNEYDRFRNRILFPIRNRQGDVLGFGARAMGDDKPKYLNSPESEVFHKSEVLYGLYENLQLKGAWNTAFVVEGYMDVIALSQHGIRGAVASMGTALTAQHMQILFRYVQDVLFCFDGDAAGRQAAWRALENVLPLMKDGRRLRFMFMPSKTDPDSYIRENGTKSFNGLIQQSVPLSEYLFGQLANQYPLDSLDGCAHFAKNALGMLNQLPEGLFKNMMLEQLNLLVDSRKALMPKSNTSQRYAPSRLAPPKLFAPTYLVAAILLRMTSMVKKVPDTLEGLDLPGLALLHSLCGMINKNSSASVSAYLKALQKRGFTLKPLIESSKRIELLPPEALEAEMTGALQRLQSLFAHQKIDVLLFKAKQNALSEQEKQLLKQFLAD